MNEDAKYPIHGSDPVGGATGWRHPGEIEVVHVDDGRTEIRKADDVPLETAFKKVDGRYRPVIRIEVFGKKGERRLEYYDADANLIATVTSG